MNYEEEVKKVYPDAVCHSFEINNWGVNYIIGKESKPFTECEEDDDFLSDIDKQFESENEAWDPLFIH